ncbi:MAG: dihydroorotate dehydrogenase electron transfer subunit [Thermodesulfovibrionales bacterium]
MSRYLKAVVTENQALNPEYNLLTLSPLSLLKEPRPGQFYMVGLPQDPLLKRPFSHFRKDKNGNIQIFFRIKGKGTALLSGLREGSTVEILGPLGRPYPLPGELVGGELVEPLPSGGATIVVAGGIGIASLYSLIERCNKPYVFYGARSSKELFFIDEIQEYSRKIFVTTDDGSAGEKGLITESLDRFLNSLTETFTVYACGPSKMLERVSEITKLRGGVAYISIEERMACGIGACLGCVVKTTAGYQRVCKEGPVFDAREIIW